MKKIINTTKEVLELVIGVDHGDKQINHRISLNPQEIKTLTDIVADKAVEVKGIEFVEEEEETEENDLSKMTKNELKVLAEEKGMELTGTESKNDLLELLSE